MGGNAAGADQAEQRIRIANTVTPFEFTDPVLIFLTGTLLMIAGGAAGWLLARLTDNPRIIEKLVGRDQPRDAEGRFRKAH